MKRNDFLNLLIQECDLDCAEVITEETVLRELEDWDSLSLITVLSLIKVKFDINITIMELKGCNTFKDILDLAVDEYEK